MFGQTTDSQSTLGLREAVATLPRFFLSAQRFELSRGRRATLLFLDDDARRRTPHRLSSSRGASTLMIVQGIRFQHADEHRQQPVRYTAQGTGMRMTSLAKDGVVAASRHVRLGRDTCPVVTRRTQPRVASIAHHHHAPCSTGFRHGRQSGQRPDGMIISNPERLRGLGGHRGGDPDADSGQGEEDRDVMMLAILPRLFSQRLQQTRELLAALESL